MSDFANRWRQCVDLAQRLIHQHWLTALKIRDFFRMSEETFHLLLAGLVGILGGLLQVTYHLCNQGLQMLLLGGSGDILDIASHMQPWLRVATPTVGALAAGWVLHAGFKAIGGDKFTNLLEVIVAGDGRLNLRPALVHGLSSLLSISSGASIGREGLIVQLVSSLSSRLGQLAQWPPYRLRLLVACGAASGLSAACNAPITGAVFASQIVLGTFAMNLFAPIVFSSVISLMVSRSLLDDGHVYVVPSFHFAKISQLGWFLFLGIGCGILGAGFLLALRASQNAFSKFKAPIYVRLALAGLVVGIIALRFPEVWGNGYSATNKILGFQEGPKVLGFVFQLSIAKLLATVITVGSGTVGGVFTPTLFLGASLGSLMGAVLHMGGLGLQLPVGVFALVGMGGMLAATTHSPLLAMIAAFELSLNYTLMPPLMLACVISALVARKVHPDSIYTESLRRKGLETSTDASRSSGATGSRVGDYMREPVPPILENTGFREIANRFLSGSNNFLPVVNTEGTLVGVVALQDLKEHLSGEVESLRIIAADVMRPPPSFLTPDQKLANVLPILVSSELRNVPVVDSPHRRRLIGRVARAEVIDMMAEILSPLQTRK